MPWHYVSVLVISIFKLSQSRHAWRVSRFGGPRWSSYSPRRHTPLWWGLKARGGGALSALNGSTTSQPEQDCGPLVDHDFFTVSSRLEGLAQDMEMIELDEEGTDEGEGAVHKGDRLRYGVIAILGPQFSGKSTLMNELFGTSFPVLDVATTGIQRTTKGVWVDMDNIEELGTSSLPLVVLDMEGLESSSRKDSSEVFDSKMAALATISADVLILNMWARDMHGGGPAWQSKLWSCLAKGEGGRRRRTLLVVLRDSEDPEGDTRIAHDTVSLQLGSAYRKASRGRREAEREVQLQVVALPSRRHQVEKFKEAVGSLRQRLVGNSSSSDKLTVLEDLSAGRASQPVALSAFPRFAVEAWESIGGQEAEAVSPALEALAKQPAQVQGLKGERPEHIRVFVRRRVVDGCCREAERAIGRLEDKLDAAGAMPILEFGQDAAAILNSGVKSLRERLSQFRVSAVRWSKGKYEEEEKHLVEALGRQLEPLFARHIDTLREYYMGRFQDGYANLPFGQLSGFDKAAKALCKDISGTFKKAAKAAVPPVMSGRWSFEGSLARLKDEMDVEIADRRMEIEVVLPPESLKDRFLSRGWWKKLLIKAFVLYVNYLQTVQAAQAVVRATRRRQETYPPVPMF